MAIEVKKGNQQQSSMGRRLLAMAGKLNGQDTGEALMGGAKAAMSQGMSEAVGVEGAGGAVNAAGDMTEKMSAGLGASPFSRRLSAKSQDPQVGLQQGLSVLEELPGDHPLKQELAPLFLQAQFKRR
jgi:hypothetical protein